jgi:hypothetical protein
VPRAPSVSGKSFKCSACGHDTDALESSCLWCGLAPKPLSDAVTLSGTGGVAGVELSERAYRLLMDDDTDK